MLNVKSFQCNMLSENCFVISNETRDALIIDCGALYPAERSAIAQYIQCERLSPVHLLCTHGHLDHCFGNNFIFEQYGLKPEVSQKDDFLAADLALQARQMFGFDFSEPTPSIGHFLQADEVIALGSHQFRVLSTPGHTPGSVLFYCEEEKILFSGDTLFRMSIGRTDFEGGSWHDMEHSLQQVVAKLPDDVRVYCGHGPTTTIGEEKQFNPYLH